MFCWTTQRATLFECLVCTELLFFCNRLICSVPFFLTIPPYIRPVISWVLTVRAHGASALTLLHQPTEGKHGREGERKTLPYFSAPKRHEVSVWSEREEGASQRRRGGRGFDASRSHHVHRFWGNSESLLHKTLSRLSLPVSFWKRGKTCTKSNDMQVHGTALTWHYLHRNSLKMWNLFSENLCRLRVTWFKSCGTQTP